MKIYCAGAIRGDRTFQEYYREIINYVQSLGHTALSEFSMDFKKEIMLTDEEIFRRDINWLNDSDMLIAEVSGPSLGVGLEIGYALYNLKMPVLAVYNEMVGRISGMISGCTSELLEVKSYSNLAHLQSIIFSFIEVKKEI